jgi:hypothetical protein
MTFVIREGDPTTTGGVVVKGSANTTIESKKAARLSDPVWCPKCSSMGSIAQGNPTVIDESVAISARVHQKYSETYGGRNTKAKQAQDAADLRAAVDNNFDAIKRGLLEEGLSESDIEAAREQLHRLSKEQGSY